jgi:hypothetical protein
MIAMSSKFQASNTTKIGVRTVYYVNEKMIVTASSYKDFVSLD